MNAPLQADTVHVRLGGRDVVHGVTASIAAGWTTIVGPNGAGKSTLLRALAGLLPLAGGQVRVHGQAVHGLPAPVRARHIAWLAQGGEASGDLTVRETVELGRIARGGVLRTPGPDDAEVVTQALHDTGCSAWSARHLAELSGGERQRVLLARVLATEAPVLLLDEPTSHLDAPHQVALARLFRRLTRPSAGGPPRTVVTVLHDLPVALRADQVLVMQAGRLVAAGPPEAPELQRELERVFLGAVRVSAVPGGAVAALVLDDGGPPCP